MRAFVTGATGFIGGRLARRLRDRGDEVVALVRSRARAGGLAAAGCELVDGDVGSEDALRRGLEGCDAAFHAAAIYRIGVPAAERARMREVNVGGTERVLDAAVAAGAARIVYVSTNNYFGDTHGRVVDETYERRLADGFLSAYDETKYQAHEAARRRIASGAPIVIALPGGGYGPGDTSQLGDLMRQAAEGKMRLLVFPTLAFNFVHVDDLVEGLVLAHDRGRVGEAYVLGGELTTMRDLVEKAARVTGRAPPRFAFPTALARPLARFSPRLGELLAASDGVTYWASDGKARAELGYAPRDLEAGLRDTFARA